MLKLENNFMALQFPASPLSCSTSAGRLPVVLANALNSEGLGFRVQGLGPPAKLAIL